jgi:4-hydroxy-tetrahydrodipicolinate synthase
MVTPLLDRDLLDIAGLERLVEQLVNGRVRAIFILGTSGEAPSLSYRLRRELITRTCQLVDNRLPILVGITDTAFVESVHLAQFAADAGAHSVVTSTPYYFPAGQPELLEYIERLVPQLPLPLFLYNMPMMTKIQFELDTLQRVAHLEKIIGLKDSSGDLAYFTKALELSKIRPDWTFLIGPEHLLAETVRLGGHGGVNGGAQIYPALFVELYEAAARSDLVRVAELQKRLLQFGKIYQVGRHASAVIKGMKCALSLTGICSDLMAEPFSPFRAPERERVRAILESVGIPIANSRTRRKPKSTGKA